MHNYIGKIPLSHNRHTKTLKSVLLKYNLIVLNTVLLFSGRLFLCWFTFLSIFCQCKETGEKIQHNAGSPVKWYILEGKGKLECKNLKNDMYPLKHIFPPTQIYNCATVWMFFVLPQGRLWNSIHWSDLLRDKSFWEVLGTGGQSF